MMRKSLLAVALLVAGCSKGSVGGNPFGTASDTMVPMQDDDDESGTDGDETAGSSGGPISESWSSGGTDPDTGDVGDTSSGGEASTAPVSASDSSSSEGGAEESSSSTGEPPTGGQPATGMYAHCYDMFFDNCTAPSTICVNITGQMEGFCTADGCSNPALDCDPAPGGTAAPICLAAGGYSVCALDCSGGATCATGMVCQSVSFDMMTNYNLCM